MKSLAHEIVFGIDDAEYINNGENEIAQDLMAHFDINLMMEIEARYFDALTGMVSVFRTKEQLMNMMEPPFFGDDIAIFGQRDIMMIENFHEARSQ